MVISPGSRSTPLTLAAVALPGLQKHIVLDERSAGFTALGIGKATGCPALLICTSGTATANYYPAVIEAKESGCPLLVATADRPARLRNTDANQTIDQIEIYGKFAQSFVDVGEPITSDEAVKKLKKESKKSWKTAIQIPGPVHLNFSFEKPLEPDSSYLAEAVEENRRLSIENTNEKVRKNNPSSSLPIELADILKAAKRPLIIIGQLPANRSIDSICKSAEKLAIPILSEQGHSGADNFIQGFEGFLRNQEMVQKLAPDLILRFGLQPASKSLLQTLNSWKPKEHIYVTDKENPIKTSLPISKRVLWDGGDVLGSDIDSDWNTWLSRWKKAEEKYRLQKNGALKAVQKLSDGHIYESISQQVPDDWFLFFSNSFPARDRSMFGHWSSQPVYTNRGASGIDGITSTAMGVCLGSKKAGVLFTGDLAFLHDTNALLNNKLLKEPLVVVVINNQGGSIFRMLPVAEHEEYFTDFFETPQEVDLKKLTSSYDLPFKRINSIQKLQEFNLKKFVEHNSNKKLLVLECQTDPDVSMQLRNRLWSQQYL